MPRQRKETKATMDDGAAAKPVLLFRNPSSPSVPLPSRLPVGTRRFPAAWTPWRGWGWLVLLIGLATPTSRGLSANTSPPTPDSRNRNAPKLAVGTTVIPPLIRQAATNQIQFREKICDELARTTSDARVYTNPKRAGESLRYRLFRPPQFDPARPYPLVLFLHGGGAVRRFEDLLDCASPVFAFGPARLMSPEAQARHPAFVVMPWSGGRSWDADTCRLIVGVLEALRAEFPIDALRIYVTGQSMGGYGTWQMLTAYPDLFAAGIPVCGGGDPTAAARAKTVAVWAFHGTADRIVPVGETRAMIEALLEAGGKPIYWEYTGGTHAKTAERAYCEPQLLDWLFAQTKGR